MNMTIKEFCNKHEACKKGIKWAVKNCQNMDEVWRKAKPEWLIWVATREGVLTDKELRLFAVWCARQVQHLMTDGRSIAGIDVAERYVNGNASEEELKAARKMVRGAAWEMAWDTPRYIKMATLASRDATWVVTSEVAWGVEWAARSLACYAVSAAAEAAYAAEEASEDWRASWVARIKALAGAREAAWEVGESAQAQYLRKNFKPNFEI